MEVLPAWLKNAEDDAKMGGYIKVYERIIGQRYFVTKKNMSVLHKGVAHFEAYGVIGDAVEFIKVANEVGTAIQEEHNGKVC